MGDLITDVMLANREKFGVQAALFNSGGIRTSFDAGNITFSDCVSVLPFGNVLVDVVFNGSQILQMLEAGAAGRNQPERGGYSMISFLRWSGIRYTMEVSAPIFHRVSNVTIRSSMTGWFEPLNPQAEYNVTTNEFVIKGGDNIVQPGRSNFLAVEDQLSGFIEYVRQHSPLHSHPDGRITFRNSTINV